MSFFQNDIDKIEAERLAESARLAVLPPPPPPPIRVPKNLPPRPYVLPETPPTVCKIALLHGLNSETTFTLPENFEIILFSGRGEELSRSAVQMITSWIHKSPMLDTLDLIPYNGVEYNSTYYPGGFPGGNNTPPTRFNNRGMVISMPKLRSGTKFRIKVLKSGNRCPNITLDWGKRNEDGVLADPVGIYNPREVVLKQGYHIDFYQKEGLDLPTSVSLLETYIVRFSLENLVAFFTERYPGEKVRIYMLSCRAGNLVPPDAGNLTPRATKRMNNGLPNLRGGKRKNKKRNTLRKRKYSH
jgi:hypothetical protein